VHYRLDGFIVFQVSFLALAHVLLELGVLNELEGLGHQVDSGGREPSQEAILDSSREDLRLENVLLEPGLRP